MAAADYTSIVQQLYVSYFGRPADPDGLNNYSKALDAIGAPTTFAEINTFIQDPANAGSALVNLINHVNSSPESVALYGAANTHLEIQKFVAAIFLNEFNLTADKLNTDGFNFWVDAIEVGGLSKANAAISILQGALDGTTAQDAINAATINNKIEVATNFTTSLDNPAKVIAYDGLAAAATARAMLATVNDTTNVIAFQSTIDATEAALVTGTVPTTTFTLTKGLDNIAGTSGNDIIIGSVEAVAVNPDLNTLSALDIIDGGSGIDTLKVATNLATAVPLGNLSNVEIVEIQGAAAVTVDTTATTGVTNLNVVKAGGAINADAGSATDFTVAIKAVGAAVDVDGGNNVTVKLTDVAGAANAVTIGTDTDGGGLDLGVAAKGDVVVEMTGKAYTTATADTTLSAVTVTGGKTVSVTQKAASDVAAAAADKTGATITEGAVTINANADTTTINVKQDATVAVNNAADTTGGQTETTTVTFGILKSGDTLAANGLTITAEADMTAAQVAAAFSNLATGLVAANKDTQGSGLSTKATYSGDFQTGANSPAGFTAAAASGDTVVFTAARANQDATDLSFTLTNTSGTSVAPLTTTVQGKAHNATATGGVMGVTAGVVTVAGGAAATAVKTITIDGYTAAGSAITGTTTALETLNLSNGGDFAVAAAAETLALNLKNVGTAGVAATLTSAAVVADPAVLDLNNTATKTLNVNSDGVNTVSLDLSGATGTTALNVSGTGLLNAATASNLGGVTTIKVTETAGLNLGATATTAVTSVDTTGTTGTVTVAISGTQSSYAGGAGVDNVTVTNANTAITKAINLGAGDDTLTLTGGTVVTSTVDLHGGDGTDTIVLSAADGIALSASSTFAGKIDGFEKLSLGHAAAAGTVNLTNLDAINYVISANSEAVGAAATKEVITIDFATSGTIAGADTVAFDGATTTLAGGESATGIALAFAGKTYTNWDVTSVVGSAVTLTAKVAGVTADVTGANVTIVDADASTAAVAVTKTTDGTTTYTFDLTGLNLDDTDSFAIGVDTLFTAGADAQDAAAVIAALTAAGGAQTIGGKAYVATSTGANVLVLTTTDATAPATLAYAATDVVTGTTNFSAGAGDAAPVAKAAGVAEVFAAQFATSGAIEDADTIAFDGTTITLASGMTPTQIAAAVAAGTYADWTAVQAGTAVNFTAKVGAALTDVANGAFTISNVLNPATKPAVAVSVASQGAAMGVGAAALTIDKMVSGGTLELTAAGAGAIVKITDAVTGTADVLNVVTKAAGSLGTVTAADVETINLNITDADTGITTLGWNDANGNAVKTANVSTTTLAVEGTANTTTINVAGAGNLTLSLAAADTKVALVDASTATGVLNLDLSAHNGVAVTVNGGSANDVLKASVGATSHADVLIGGAGNDILWAGSNGAKLTGGEGNDLFVLQAGAKEVNTYTSIQDFSAGDVLKVNVTAGTAVTDISKLTATLNETTSVFSNFVEAAIQQANTGEAVWFSFKGNAYVVVDNIEVGGSATATSFENGVDAVIELVGVDGTLVSYNAQYGTLALV